MILNKIGDIVNGVAVRYPDAVAAGLVLGNLLEGEIRKAGEDGTWLKVLQKCTEGRAEGQRVAKTHGIKRCKNTWDRRQHVPARAAAAASSAAASVAGGGA